MLTITTLQLHIFLLLLGAVTGRASLVEDKFANSTDHTPNPITAATATKPTPEDEKEKSETSLDEIKNLVESLTRQVNNLKKSQTRDRSHIRSLEHRLHSTTDKLQKVEGEVTHMQQVVTDNRERASQLEDTNKSERRLIRNVQSSSEKNKQDLDNIKSFRETLNRNVSRLSDDVTRLDKKGRELEDSVAGMMIDSTKLRTLQLKQKSGLKHVKVELAGFIESCIPDEDDDDNAGEDGEREVIPSENIQGAGDGYQSELGDNSAGELSETKSVEGSGVDEKISLSKRVNTKQNTRNHNDHLGSNNNHNKNGEKKIKKEMKIMKNSLVEKDIEIGKLYNMVLNLTLQMSQLENKVLSLQKDREMLEVQQAAANFSQYLLALDQWRITGPLIINTTQDTQEQLDAFADLILNNSNRVGKLEVKHLDLKYLMEYVQHKIEENFHSMNESLKKMKHRVHNHNHKGSNMYEDILLRLDDYSLQAEKMDTRLLGVEVKVLNRSLNQCSKQQSDFYQDQQLREVEKKAEKLQESVVVHRETLTRMDRGLYRLHLDMKRHNKTIDSLKKENTKIIGYLPQFYEMQQEVEKFLHHLPKDCDQIYRLGQKETGEYIIHPEGSTKSVRVYCDMTKNGGWTVIQRRSNGNEHFSRFWSDYKKGFGTVGKEFWLGNEYIHLLTKQKNCSLHIEMHDILGQTWIAEYQVFRMNDESSKYSLFVDSYHGNATDSLGDANGMAFSTEDRDQDASSTHCALYYTSGWWYKHCHYCNLNGRYNVGIVWFNRKINEWLQLNRTIMKIKPHKR